MKRYNNFDILRILSCIAVIMIHVSSTYRGDYDFDEKDMLGIIIYNTLSRFAVPCFVMLAGAFALSNKKTVIMVIITEKPYLILEFQQLYFLCCILLIV